MKKIITIIVLMIIRNLAGLRDVKAQREIEIVLPKSQFDFKLASDMLNSGKSEIKSAAFWLKR